MQPLFRYGLDLIGNDPDNFVGNELKQLSTRRNRAVVPAAGPFYADSAILIDQADFRILVRGIDWVPVELNQILSLRTGKDIFGAMLVINRQVSSVVQISYQCVGGENEQSGQAMFDLLEKIPDDRLDFSWYEIDGKPLEWDPTPHLHPLGSPESFEKLTHVLDRIQQAITYTDLPAFRNLLLYINTIFDEINQSTKYKMDAFFGTQLASLKRELDKAFFEVDQVNNYQTATEDDGRIAARSDSISKNFPTAKYIALNALISFKNSVYNTFVLSETTKIGLNRGFELSPDAGSILELTTGSMRTLPTKKKAIADSDNANLSIYPEDADENDAFVILKVAGNRTNSGGIYFLVETTGSKFYVAKHDTGIVFNDFIHARFTTDTDFQVLINKLFNHINDGGTAHQVKADQVDLGFVEDLPIITIEEILCLDNKRKYITFDLLLLFIKTFMIGKDEGDDDAVNGEQNPVELLDIFKCSTGVVEDEVCCPEPVTCPEVVVDTPEPPPVEV